MNHLSTQFDLITVENIFYYQVIMAEQLRVEDLNHVIRYFATQISQQIGKLENIYRPQSNSRKVNTSIFTTLQSVSKDTENIQQQINEVLQRYSGYFLKLQVEVEYVRKFNHRILQIFGFYKWKCKSQSILTHAERQLANKLNILMASPQVHFGKIVDYVVGICRKGFINKNPFLLTKDSKPTPKSNSSFERKPKFGITNIVAEETVGCFGFQKKKRAISVMSSYGMTPVAKSNHPQSLQLIETLYGCLNIDKGHLLKVMESQNCFQREQLKRNKSTIRKINNTVKQQSNHNSHRKMKTENTMDLLDQNVLNDIRNRTKLVNCFQADNKDGLKKATNYGMVFHKKRKVKTSQKRRNYQSQCLNNQNVFT